MIPDVQKFIVTCLNCKRHSRINILDGKDVMYVDYTPIIACRLRGDMKWGFECMCGNDSRLAREEADDAKVLVQASHEDALNKLIDSLKIKDESKFRMEPA